jgi:hypothetical protein
MSVFGFNFYDEKYQIKMIPKGGPLENFIRDAYFGGSPGLVLLLLLSIIAGIS